MTHPHRFAGRLSVLIIIAVLCLATQSRAWAQGPIRIIWLHHSVGFGIIDGGGVREGLTARGYEFYDHGYNDDGLRLADGSSTGTNFGVPDDNTDPDGLATIFSQPLHNPPDNTFSYLMQYDVIMLKSCFPTSNIADDAQLEADKQYYQTIAQRMDGTDKILIIVTHPPQVPQSTDSDEARRARALNDWLLSDAFQSGHSNLYVFDLFGRLAGSDNLLRAEYRVSDDDAHPNDIANAAIGPQLVDFVDESIRGGHISASQPSAPSEGDQPTEPPAEQPQSAVPAAAVGMVDDFEAGVDAWHGETDRDETAIECGADSELAHGGSSSLRLSFDIASEGWITCGRSFDSSQNWGGTTGISLWVRTDTADQGITFGLYSGKPDAATPFETFFGVPAESVNAWAQVSLPWSDFNRAEWADASGLSELDPAQIIGYSISLGTGEEARKGNVWIDDVELSGGSAAAIPPQADESSAQEPVQTEQAGQQASKGICGSAGAILLLPLAAGMVIANRRRNREGR